MFGVDILLFLLDLAGFNNSLAATLTENTCLNLLVEGVFILL